MKILVMVISAVLLVSGLSGCTTSPTKAPVKTICPACGYEFHLPLSGM